MRWCSWRSIWGQVVNNLSRNLSEHYATRLRGYLAREEEKHLAQAYELGRKLLRRGLGLLDLARIHQQALASCQFPSSPMGEKARAHHAAESFLMAALAPFEAAHRGFREANFRLHQLNETLQHRNAELASMTRELEQSEHHYRQLFGQARLMEEDLRNLSNQILHVQEEERGRLSRELHDEVGQALALMELNLAILQRTGTAEAKLLQQKITDTQHLLATTRETVHRFARELRPAMLDELGLLPALRAYLKTFADRTELRVSFAGAIESEQLNPDQKTVLYRVAQESLTNVAKHAHARSVHVSLRAFRDRVQMQIQDDGRGFRVERRPATPAIKRLGLIGMRERVRLIHGQCSVNSVLGKGTTIVVEVPMKAGNGPAKSLCEK
jgi:signal transduction histidine kinase